MHRRQATMVCSHARQDSLLHVVVQIHHPVCPRKQNSLLLVVWRPMANLQCTCSACQEPCQCSRCEPCRRAWVPWQSYEACLSRALCKQPDIHYGLLEFQVPNPETQRSVSHSMTLKQLVEAHVRRLCVASEVSVQAESLTCNA